MRPERKYMRMPVRTILFNNSSQGFSLVELAIVLVVVALLLGGLLVPLTMQIEQQRIRETQKTLEEVKEALVGYALSHMSQPNGRPYLPCPDINAAISGFTPNDGLEDRNPTTGSCADQEGNVPWATLGTADIDSWGNRMRYRVLPNFSSSVDGFQLATSLTTQTMRVCTGNACVSTLAAAVPAVILSHGKNGLGAINLAGNGNTQPIAAALDEAQNANSMSGSPNRNFTSRTITGAQSPCSDSAPGPTQPLCEFDDLVTWLSPNILFNRMVAAGRLP